MVIRPEMQEDIAAIRGVHLAAFAGHPHSHQTEHLIVEALRNANALTISLVAETDGKVVGHVAFSPAWIDGRDCGWYLLGPVGVLPPFQRQGIGQGLIRAGLQALRLRRAQGCALVGAAAYYARFGFRGIPELVIEGFPAEYFLCLPLADQIPSGTVTYHSAFAAGE